MDIKNLDVVKIGNNEFTYGDTCIIERGRIVTVVGIAGNRVLVRYFIDRTVYGTSCPNGAVFFLTKERFYEMRREYCYHHCDCDCNCHAVTVEDADKKLVRKLLNK